MAGFTKYPYTDYSNMNLDWIIEKIRETMDEQTAQRAYMDMLKAWMEENEPRIDEIESLYNTFMNGELPTAVQTALTDWLEQYGVLAEAKAYADEKTAAVNSALAQEVTARTTQGESLQAQINDLVVPSGDAPSAAEVINARTGYDGTVYDTLGDAIRTQVEDTRDYVTNEKTVIDSLALKTTCEGRVAFSSTHDYYWDVSGNVATLTQYPQTGTNWYASERVGVVEGDIYRIHNAQGPSHKTRIWAIVDENNNILSKAEDYYSSPAVTMDGIFAVPAGGKYLVFTAYGVSGDSPYIRHMFYSPAIKDRIIPMAFEKSWYWNIETEKAIKTYYGGSNYRASTVIPVKAGERYAIYAAQGGTNRARIWIACDDAMNIIAMADNYPSANFRTLRFTIPEGATRLAISSFGADDTVPYATLTKEQETIYDYLDANNLKGKNVAILGDSISTNGNSGDWANTPEITIQSADIGVQLSAYLTYYDVQAGLSLGGHTFTSDEIGTEVTFTPVSADLGKKIGLPDNYNPNARITWWEHAAQYFGFNPINVSWSGASVSSHEGNAAEYKTSYAWHDAQIRKCGIRVAGTMTRVAPDVIIIYRGVNDFSHAPYVHIDDSYFDGVNWQYPDNDMTDGNYDFGKALALTIKKLRAAYPNAQIILCTMNAFKRVNYAHYPVNNGLYTLPAFNDYIRKTADFFGCITLDIDRDGITYENLYTGGFVTDNATTPTHPNDIGQYVIGTKAIADLKAKYNTMC